MRPPETIVDEASGIQVPNAHREYYDQGYIDCLNEVGPLVNVLRQAVKTLTEAVETAILKARDETPTH